MKAPGFSLLEILLAMVLSSFVIIILMQTPRQLYRLVAAVQKHSSEDFKIGRVFEQLERDISCACMPTFFSDEKVKKKDQKSETQKEEKKPAEPEFFVLSPVEDKYRSQYFKSLKDESKSFPFLKTLSMITTSPLSSYRNTDPRLVRVTYECEKDREKTIRDAEVFKLYRSQTEKLKTAPDEKTRGTDVWKESRILVLDDIKECFLELSYTDTTEQEKTGKDKKIEPKHVFEWGKKEPEKNRLPEKARFQIALWDEDKKGAVPFSVSIPIFACTLSQTKDGVEPGAKKDSDDKKTEKKKNRQPDRSATTGAVSNKAPASGVQEGVLEGVPA